MTGIASTLTTTEITLLSIIVEAAQHGLECPTRIKLKSLVDKGLVRVETYVLATHKKKYCRVVTIIDGDYVGKQTMKPTWIPAGLSPTYIQDSRPAHTINALGLLAPRDIVGVKTTKAVSLGGQPPWRT